MKIREAAYQLDGNEYGNVGTQELWDQMKESGLVAVFGYFDDSVEFRGAIYDEVPVGDDICISNGKLLQNDCEDYHCPYFEEKIKECKNRIVVRDGENPDFTYHPTFPHTTFNVKEDDHTYCVGIVFNLNELED